MYYTILRQEMCLLAEKALFWPSKDMLIVADVHLGKAGHFRKSGIPIPSTIHLTDLHTLGEILHKTGASTILFLGDLFHSLPNNEWLLFEKWLLQWQKQGINRQAILVMGNHDIHGAKQLPSCLTVCDLYEAENIVFSHEPLLTTLPHQYNIAGHLHPAISIRLKGASKIKLPCFYFEKHHGLLPAFGQFNSHMTIKANKEAVIFAIVEGEVLKC